ncbi:hypothetical protein HDU81_011344, partial [Chytriomyces hyalinus]
IPLADVHIILDHVIHEPMLLKVQEPINVLSDIHGQLFDLLRHFEMTGYPPNQRYLFLGDIVDRRRHSIESVLLLFTLKIRYPNTIYITRGNHESASLNKVYGFYDECKQKYSVKLWKSFTDCFNQIPIAALISNKIFACHGGLSPDLQIVKQIDFIQRPLEVPDLVIMCDLLWANPDCWQVLQVKNARILQQVQEVVRFVIESKVNQLAVLIDHLVKLLLKQIGVLVFSLVTPQHAKTGGVHGRIKDSVEIDGSKHVELLRLCRIGLDESPNHLQKCARHVGVNNEARDVKMNLGGTDGQPDAFRQLRHVQRVQRIDHGLVIYLVELSELLRGPLADHITERVIEVGKPAKGNTLGNALSQIQFPTIANGGQVLGKKAAAIALAGDVITSTSERSVRSDLLGLVPNGLPGLEQRQGPTDLKAWWVNIRKCAGTAERVKEARRALQAVEQELPNGAATEVLNGAATEVEVPNGATTEVSYGATTEVPYGATTEVPSGNGSVEGASVRVMEETCEKDRQTERVERMNADVEEVIAKAKEQVEKQQVSRRVKWMEAETTSLINGVARYEKGNWRMIRQLPRLERRQGPTDLKDRWINIRKCIGTEDRLNEARHALRTENATRDEKHVPNKVRACVRWSDEETHILLAGVEKYGVGKWALIRSLPRLEQRQAYMDLRHRWVIIQKNPEAYNHLKTIQEEKLGKREIVEEYVKLCNERSGRVYALSTDLDGIYKIGFTLASMSNCICSLQTGCVIPIRVIAEVETGKPRVTELIIVCKVLCQQLRAF